MPLARHDGVAGKKCMNTEISTHMPLARHDLKILLIVCRNKISTHMPLARHDAVVVPVRSPLLDFYSHASCEA